MYIYMTDGLVGFESHYSFFSPSSIIIKIRSIFPYAMKSYNSLFRLFFSLYSPGGFLLCVSFHRISPVNSVWWCFSYILVSSYWVLHIMWMDLNLSSPGCACSNTLSPYFPLSRHIFTQQLLNAFVRPHCIYITIRQRNAIKKTENWHQIINTPHLSGDRSQMENDANKCPAIIVFETIKLTNSGHSFNSTKSEYIYDLFGAIILALFVLRQS